MLSKEGLKPLNEQLIITTQQSRFHVDATTSLSKEIDIRDLNISIGNKPLLTQANLKLHGNRKYVLTGRNGTGKSTLLRALADGSIPGLPPNVKTLLLGQTEVVANPVDIRLAGMAVDEESVLTHVLRSDSTREQALREAQILSEALDVNDSLAVVRAVRRLRLEHLEKTHARAKDFATRRSGARGIRRGRSFWS